MWIVNKHTMGLYADMDWNVIGTLLGIRMPETPPDHGGLLVGPTFLMYV